ncbi:MAG: tetratricopeptide repeat protein [Spirochaetes bacterium]|nr:tetratricopeptide repeat protein [Spirochaetota bacterium]
MQEIDGKIEYTPEELREIERILGYISQETLGHLPANEIPDAERYHDKEQEMHNDNVDIDLQHKHEQFPEEMEILGQDIGEEQDFQYEHEETEPGAEEEAEKIEEIADITDLIQEINEEKDERIPEESFQGIPPEKISTIEEVFEEPSFETEEEDLTVLKKKEQIQDIPEEEDFDMDLLAEELEKQQEEEEPSKKAERAIPPIAEEPLFDEDTLTGLESPALTEFDIEGPEEILKAAAEQKGKIRGKETLDLDISDISPVEEIETEYAEPAAVKPGIEKVGTEIEDEFPDIDFTGLDEPKSRPDKNTPPAESSLTEIPEAKLSTDLDKIHDLFADEKPGEFSLDMDLEPDVKPSIKDEFTPDAQKEKIKKTEEEIELSDNELKKLNKVIQFFHPNLTKIIKDVIINDLLSGTETRELVDILLSGSPEEDVKSYLEKKLNKKIDVFRPAKGRRVIAARPEYTEEGRERKTRLYKISGLFAAAAIVLVILGVLAYQNIYIPVMAKKNIDEGVSLIKKPGVPVIQKQRDYKKAEEIFNHVNDNYIKDYLYGYHSYAKAYFQNKEYDYALDKLNKAYEIDASNVDTLINLGFFYSKLPAPNFEKIKPQLDNYYYKKIKPAGPVDKQIDVAIDFYRKAINKDPENITALYGIGNAYTNQGEYYKARQYYENILAVDKESVVGYSGLLNLYIERDALPEILTIHTDLGNRKKLSDVPSALLAKLASYYLSKKRTDERNIRIDYGVQSPSIKDFNDNPYPAVKNVLNALTARDIEYPPLFLQFAKLSKEENNLNLMKRNLLTALEKDPNYFAAHILLAQYYYMTNDFVEAYKSCKKAEQAYLSPPEFTNEDFFHETEKIGAAYAIMGNIFYYADKMKFRFGDEFDEGNNQEKSDKLANYSIAQEKYEKSIEENYKSSEVFYNLGRIYYVKGQYDKATSVWLNLYEDFTAEPELLFALGNAFYHQDNLEAGKGEYLKVISFFESKADRIPQIVPGRNEHTRIYQNLASAYNNLGAIYQIQNNESKSNISYWKAIEYAKKIEKENEFARVNLARAFKTKRENVLPIIDENIAVTIDTYKEFK